MAYNYSSEVKLLAEQKICSAISYAEAQAWSLIAYAGFDKVFAKKFKKIIKDNFPKKKIKMNSSLNENSYLLMPESGSSALDRAKWLAEQVKKRSLIKAEDAEDLLVCWGYSKEQEIPMQIIIGVVGLAIPGITLGKVSRRRSLNIIVSDRTVNLDYNLTKKIASASTDIIVQSFQSAGGDLNNLEPEVALWLTEGKNIKFYKTGNKNLAKIIDELKRINLIHSLEKNEKGELELAAISPAASNYLDIYWPLSEISVE